MTAGILGRETGTGAPQIYPLGSGLAIVGGALTATGGGGSGGYPAFTAPTGFSVTGSGTASIVLTFAAGYSLPQTASQANWDTAFSERRQWDGSATGLNAVTGRNSLGLGTAATTSASDYATAAQGAKADTAVQPAGLSSYLTAATAASTYQPLDSDLTAIAALSTTAYGRAFLALADAAAARNALSLGTAATAAAADFATATHTQAASTISDSTAVGRSVLTAVDAAAARTAIGAGTGSVTGVTATGPITSSGGTAPVISISMATGRLLGRSTVGTGVAEEITIGPNLTLSGGVLSASVTGGGGGTVSSVGLSLPGLFSVSGSPVTTAGTLTATLATQSAGLVLAGPSTGAAAAPTFRQLGYSELSGLPPLGGAASLSVGTTAGTVAAGDDARLSDSREWSASTITQAEAEAGTATTRRAFTAQRVFQAAAAWWAGYRSAIGDALATAASAAAARMTLGLGTLATQSGTFSGTSSGTNTGDQTIQLTGDVTGSGTGSFAATLANTTVTAGSYGSATQVGTFTVDGKGRLTASGNTSISVPATAISDSTATGRSVLTAVDAAAARSAIGAGTGNGTVTSVTGTAPIVSSGGATPAISLADTAVTPGSYTYSSITVDAQGRLTAASSGTAPVTSVSATGPITSSGGATPTISTSMATGKLLGRSTAGTGVVEEITLGSGLSLSAGTLTATGGGGGYGTVTSVGLSLPGLFSVTGSPVTTSGTLTASLATQSANRIWAGPTTGADAAPSFRALVAEDFGTTLSPQFTSIGLGVAPVPGMLLAVNGGALFYSSCFQRVVTVIASSGVYTLSIDQSNFFAASAAIAGSTTVNLGSLSTLPANSIWLGSFEFSYTSGTIAWFSGNSGYTVKWDNDTALTLNAGKTYRLGIELRGTQILLTSDRGRAT